MSDNEDGSLTQQYIDESIRQSNERREYNFQFDPLPRLYIKEGIQDTQEQFDHRFGIYRDTTTEKFQIGDSEGDFEGPDIRIKNINYPGTPGLYELLFRNHPIGYNKKDEIY